MKSVLLIACVLLVSACGKKAEEEYTYEYYTPLSEDGVDAYYDPSTASTLSVPSAPVVHNSAECPDLDGTYTFQGSKSFQFSKDGAGQLQVNAAGDTLPVNGQTVSDGIHSITVSCANNAVVWQQGGTSNFTLRMSKLGNDMIVTADGANQVLTFSKQ